jgi:membrane fusion protein (multidrug efflux system)
MPDTAERPRLLRWALLIAAALLLMGGYLLEASAPEAEAIGALGRDAALREVGVLRVAAAAVATRVEVAGVLEPRRSVLLFAETNGPVMAAGAEALDRVESGLVLVEIDPLLAEVAVERAAAAVTRAQSELALAESNFERQSSLAQRGVASTSDLDDAVNARAVASASLREARAESKRARDDLGKKTIRAPFDGVLRSFDVEVGEFVQVGQRLGELLDTSMTRITIGLRDRDIVAVRAGQAVSVSVEAHPGQSFPGEVLRVGSASDSVTRKFPVEVELPSSDGRLLPGMVATVAVDLGEPIERMLIPRDATLSDFGVHSVFVIEGQGGEAGWVARRRTVGLRPAPFRPGEFEVVSGLEAGEQVAITAVRQLRDGEPVRLGAAALQ